MALPKSWVLTSVDEICDFYAGFGFPIEMQGIAGQELPFYKVKDVSIAWLAQSAKLVETENSLSREESDRIKAKPVPEGTVVFAKIGEALRLNRRAIAPRACLIDNNLMGIHAPSTWLASQFLFWFTLATRFDVEARASVVPSIRKSDVGGLPFPLPPLAEQTRIVAKLEELLSDLDAGVAELKAAQKKLKQYRQSLLKSAVEGALTADWRAAQSPLSPRGRGAGGEGVSAAFAQDMPPLPNPSPARGEGLQYETGAALLQRILQERRARWEAKQLAKFKEQGKPPPKDWQKKYPEPVQPDTTGLPALPEGWVWASAEQACDFITKGTTPPKDLDDGGLAEVPFLRVTNLTDTGKLDFSDRVFVSSSTHHGFLARSVVLPGDVLMNIVGPPLGQVSRVPDDYLEWNINQAIAIFRAVPGILNDLLCFWLLSPTIKQWFKKRAKTTAGQTNLTLELCRSLPIALPPEHEQMKIVEVIKTTLHASDAQQAAIEKSLKQSTAQRQNILRAAFAGQLVPQDPSDEPASVLLERIRAERAAQSAAKPTRGRKPKVQPNA